MNHTFQILEFNRILERLEELAHTDGAKERIRNLTPELKEAEVRKNLPNEQCICLSSFFLLTAL